MELKDLGYNSTLEMYRIENKLDAFEVGRVIAEHRERYVVKTETEEFDAELIGNLRYTAQNRHDLPAVGDWVAISEFGLSKALIHAVYPRHSILQRQSVGKTGQIQIIAANVDYGLIVQSVNRDFNINRLERYLTICNAANVSPIIVISKIDLMEEDQIELLINEIKGRIKNTPILKLSSQSGYGLFEINNLINKGKTYCLLGSSGVGKSTLLNKLLGQELMKTDDVSDKIDRGKHVTSHRELIILENGGILIDNPGLRQVGITSNVAGIESTFEEFILLSEKCKFKDCKHKDEIGCAILEAIKAGDLSTESYENFQKMEKERSFFESTVAQRKKKQRKMSKLIRKVVKQKKKDKY